MGLLQAQGKLRLGVEAALLELGSGFLENPANGELRDALQAGRLTRQAYYEELLRLVYRSIFLFAAEDRGLLHTPNAPDTVRRAYRDGYSVGRLAEKLSLVTAISKSTLPRDGNGNPGLDRATSRRRIDGAYRLE